MAREELTLADFRRWCRELRPIAALKMPVIIRRVTYSRDDVAACYVDESRRGRAKLGRIYIDRDLDKQATADALIHELAHLMAYEEVGDADTHGEVFESKHWGLYRAWHRTR